MCSNREQCAPARDSGVGVLIVDRRKKKGVKKISMSS